MAFLCIGIDGIVTIASNQIDLHVSLHLYPIYSFGQLEGLTWNSQTFSSYFTINVITHERDQPTALTPTELANSLSLKIQDSVCDKI